jgi:AcrR family transcriptional regulator
MDKGADRRERIIREAAAHFLHDGFERTSMDRIAASAKVSKQAIYEYFRDKEDLFDRVVRAALSPGNKRGLADGGDFYETVAGFAEGQFDSFAKPRNYGLFRANIVATRRFPQLAADLHEYRRSKSHNLAAYLERCVAEGQLPPFAESPVDFATRVGGMAVEGSRYFLGYKVPGKQKRRIQARFATRIFCDGMRDAEAPSGLDPQPPFVPAPAEPPGKVQMRMPPERFDALCDAAADEFLAHGFEGASLDPITAATSVGRATIYRQFGGKAGLFAHAIAREIAVQWRDIAVPEGATPLEQLENLCRTVLELHLAPRSIALHYLLVQESDLFPELARSFYDMQVDRAGRPFARIAETAGMAPPAPAVTRMFFTLASYGVRYVVSLRPVPQEERETVSRQAAHIILQGVAGQAGREAK